MLFSIKNLQEATNINILDSFIGMHHLMHNCVVSHRVYILVQLILITEYK